MRKRVKFKDVAEDDHVPATRMDAYTFKETIKKMFLKRKWYQVKTKPKKTPKSRVHYLQGSGDNTFRHLDSRLQDRTNSESGGPGSIKDHV